MSSRNNRLGKPILIHQRRNVAATGKVMGRRFVNNSRQAHRYAKTGKV